MFNLPLSNFLPFGAIYPELLTILLRYHVTASAVDALRNVEQCTECETFISHCQIRKFLYAGKR